MERKIIVSLEVDIVFVLTYLPNVWDALKLAGFDTKAIAAQCWHDLKDSKKNISDEKWFLIWGMEVLNPLMNLKLGRPIEHPSFRNMMEYALKEKIDLNGTVRDIRIKLQNQGFLK